MMDRPVDSNCFWPSNKCLTLAKHKTMETIHSKTNPGVTNHPISNKEDGANSHLKIKGGGTIKDGTATTKAGMAAIMGTISRRITVGETSQSKIRDGDSLLITKVMEWGRNRIAGGGDSSNQTIRKTGEAVMAGEFIPDLCLLVFFAMLLKVYLSYKWNS